MGAFSKLMAITFATLLAKPFKNWKAFKLGLINEKGDKIKEAKTPEEKKALAGIKDFVRKLKRLLIKVLPDSRLLGFLITLYLLKKESISEEENEIKEEIDNVLTKRELNDMLNYLNICKNMNLWE